MPNCLTDLDCSYNNLTDLDNLPSSIINLNCSGNSIEILANLPKFIETIEYYGTIINKPEFLKIIKNKKK